MKDLFPSSKSLALLSCLAGSLISAAAFAQPGPPPPPPAPAPLPPVPVPAGNPITEPKRVLGKILFFDEQLSFDNTTACVSCHQINRGGVDPRRARTAGFDGILNTPDDVIASPGVIKSDPLLNYVRTATTTLTPQATPRTSMPMINAAYSPTMFWDGRATARFTDPESGLTALQNNGAFESQAVGPPESDVEMAHQDRDWGQIAAKLARSRPLALATNLTNDTANAITANPTYPMLFEAAFGDGKITAQRIAFAIATYQRTLISDQSPFDRFTRNVPGALTPAQTRGWGAFNASNCVACHVGANLTGNGFRNIGLRPFAEDVGQAAITNNPADRGKFKVPNLRNVGLRTSFMHNGQITTLGGVIGFYAQAPGALPQFRLNNNQDPLMANVAVPPQAVPDLTDFLANALLDVRVRDGVFPFDSVTTSAQRPDTRPTRITTGTAGSGGIVPIIVANMPSLIGSPEFRIGIDAGGGGATATLLRSRTAPVGNTLDTVEVAATVVLSGTGNGAGFGTAHLPIPADGGLDGVTDFFQWVVSDAGATGGVARSAIVRVTYFCGTGGCVSSCTADIAGGSGMAPGDGTVDGGDFIAFINAFSAGTAAADIADTVTTSGPDGNVDGNDFIMFINAFSSGC
jgi:cytochrome c peroxidase